eukprot:9296029-Pyramimonas_sp.AAC.1
MQKRKQAWTSKRLGSRGGPTWKEEERGRGGEAQVVPRNEPALGKLCMQGASKPGLLLETRQPFAKLHAGGDRGQGQPHVGKTQTSGRNCTVAKQRTSNNTWGNDGSS